MKTVAIIQARMGSTRLPGKVLMEVKNKPLLLYMYERVKAAKRIDDVIIATSNEKIDEVIVNFCQLNKIDYICGSLNDVLDRYYHAAKNKDASLIVRLTSDCPLIDPKVIDLVVATFQDGDYDFAANTAPPEGVTYPEGMDVEVFSISALRNAWKNANKPSEREHVTFYFWKNAHKFKCIRLDLPSNKSNYRLTVDYLEDFLVVSKILEALYIDGKVFSMSKIFEFLDHNPDIFNINSKIKPFSGWESSLNED